jgi:hypothetical protein
MRKGGIVVELDQATCDGLSYEARLGWAREIETILGEATFDKITFEPYRRGSAFLREQTEVGR